MMNNLKVRDVTTAISGMQKYFLHTLFGSLYQQCNARILFHTHNTSHHGDFLPAFQAISQNGFGGGGAFLRTYHAPVIINENTYYRYLTDIFQFNNKVPALRNTE